MSQPSPTEIAQAFLDALENRDFDRAAGYLSREQFEYVGPTSCFSSAEAFINDISRVGPILKRLEMRRLFAEAQEVLVIFDVIATIPELSNTRVAEWIRVEDGRITRIESFFDAHAYVSMFESATPV